MPTTISGNLKTLLGVAVTANCFVRFYLRGCNGAQARVSGTALIPPASGTTWYIDIAPDGSGNITGSTYSNDVDIDTTLTPGQHPTWYGVVIYQNGIAGPETPYNLADATTFNLNTATPLTTIPAISPPTGDATYLRLDGGNLPSTGSPGLVRTAPSANQTVVQPTGTSLFVNRFENIRFADQFATGSTTGGIQEAINDLPASGGTVWLPAGTTTCTAGIMINKPIHLLGHSMGGPTDPGTDLVYTAGSTIVNNTTGTDLITLALPTGNSLTGVVLENFAIQGNKNVVGVTAGDNLVISGGSSATQIRDIVIDKVLSYLAKGNGLTIKGNAYLIKVNNSQFLRNAGNGIAVANNSTGIPSQISLSEITSDLNTGDALNMNGSNVQDVSAFRCTFADSANGVNVVAGSTNATFSGIFCNFESNSNAGVLLKDGISHFVGWSKFIADGVQLFGVNVDPPAGANFVNTQISLLGNYFASNLTKDVQFSANLHVGYVGPQGLRGFGTGYTYLDSSGAAIVFDVQGGVLTFTGLNFTPQSNGGAALGSSSLKWSDLFLTGAVKAAESAAPSGAASQDIVWADSTAHRLKMNNNNLGAWTIPGTVDSSNVDLTGQSATLADQTIITGSASTGGHYTVCIQIYITATDASGATVTGTVKFTSEGIARTFSLGAQGVNSTANFTVANVPINADASTNVTVGATVTGVPTTGRYAIHAWAVKQ